MHCGAPSRHRAQAVVRGRVLRLGIALEGQNGVDHVDGHRSPGYVISPYAVQHGSTDHTYYTQVNIKRTIEQILGLTPMNQFDLVASPMRIAIAAWFRLVSPLPKWAGESNNAQDENRDPYGNGSLSADGLHR